MASQSKLQFSVSDQSDPMPDRILDAAQHCMERFGIRRMSVGEVARVGNVSRATVYRYFSDKDSLVGAVFSRRREHFLNRTEAALEQLPSLVDKLTYAVVMGRHDSREGLFARLAEIEPETVAVMFLDSSVYARSVDFWPPHIAMAQAQGEVAAEVSPALATDLLMRLLVSLVLFPNLGLELHNEDEIRRYLQQVVGHGLANAVQQELPSAGRATAVKLTGE